MDILRFGVIGAGYFGKHYVRLLAEGIPGAALEALATPSGRELPGAEGLRNFRDFHKLLSNRDIDAVIIATPASLHAEMAEVALQAGKHVLVEKPMVTRLEDAERLFRAVQESDRVFMVGHQYLYHDVIRYLRDQLSEGLLGDVRYVTAENLYSGPIRRDIGCFWETATHELAIVDYLFAPGEIKTSGGVAVDIGRSGREDFAAAHAVFENGLAFGVTVSWFSPVKIRRFILGGTEGSALFDDREPKDKLKFFLTPFPESRPDEYSRFFGENDYRFLTPEIHTREPLRNQLLHFINCIQTNTAPLTGIRHGLRVTQYLDTLSRSLRSA